MKKIYLSLIALFCSTVFSYAQNTSPWPSSGNVGIGTITPQSALDVNGMGRFTQFGNPSSGTGVEIGTSSGVGIIQGYARPSYGYIPMDIAGSTLSLNIGATPSLFINPSGYVGIGTTNPAAKLSIQESSNTAIHLINTSGSQIWGFAVDATVANDQKLAIIDQTAGVVRLAINTTGNVGIGTTSPAYNLDVAGAIHAGDIFYGTGANLAGGNIQFANVNASYISGNSVIGNDGSANFGGTLTVSMAAYPGKVGIGTTSPDEKLTVNGTVHSTEVKVDMSVPYPDYVFKPAYRLLRLSEVKAYIDKNHHLPEAPTEDEVAKNGLNVGQSEALLLKKVEELTLYLIEQQKINNALLKRINRLESKSSNKKLAK